MASYKGKYLKTYLWSGISLLLNFISMFIVAPLTTCMPEAYGVYSLCISFNIFLRYADLGFITAGRKYAAEAYSVSNYELEKKYIGTSMFIYSMMSMFLFFLVIFFSAKPECLIKDIDCSPYYNLAHQLLLIFAFTIPLSTIQKFCSLIYSIRIEEFKIQRLQILGSMIKIASVPVYFFNQRYDIVGYYLFCELINLLVSLIILYYSKNIGYGGVGFLSCLKINKSIFNEIKSLALSGFISAIGWVLYYEMDTVAISILLGANAVAIYAVGKQIQNFIRSLVGIVFSPYPVRINYFIGNKDFNGLKRFYFKLVEELSVIIIPIISIVLFARPFILSWVGDRYEESVVILQLLVLTFIIHHITSQGSAVIYGLNKVKDILKLGVIQPVLFWVGVLVTFKLWGVVSFAIFKLVACMITEIYYCYLTWKYLEYTQREFCWDLLAKPLLVIGISCSLFWCVFSHLLETVSKGHNNLMLVILIIGLCGLFALLVDLFYNRSLRDELLGLIRIVFMKKEQNE